jgi:uncharacterized protein (TIGR04255 family)
MNARPVGLPNYENPPVTEVAFSIQFNALPRFTAPYVGLLWDRFRPEFSEIEEHPPLPEVFERFDIPQAQGIEFQFDERPPSPRVWFLNGDKTDLIQIQQSRFVHNWRKLHTDKQYRRYEVEREAFRVKALKLTSFLAENELGELNINQCELTYVNHITPCAVWKTHSDGSSVFNFLRDRSGRGFLPKPEDGTFQMRFRMNDSAGIPYGRLLITVKPAWRNADKVPIFVMSLTARGIPPTSEIDGVLKFFDVGREWIVKAFDELTTEEMHHEWRRTSTT